MTIADIGENGEENVISLMKRLIHFVRVPDKSVFADMRFFRRIVVGVIPDIANFLPAATLSDLGPHVNVATHTHAAEEEAFFAPSLNAFRMEGFSALVSVSFSLACS